MSLGDAIEFMQELQDSSELERRELSSNKDRAAAGCNLLRKESCQLRHLFHQDVNAAVHVGSRCAITKEVGHLMGTAPSAWWFGLARLS